MSQHIKGPWFFALDRFNNPEHGDKIGSIIDDAGDFILAEVCGDAPNARANAQVMATAWELLEALKWCTNHLQIIERRDYPDIEEKHRRFSSTASGLAAIAKAEGR